MLTVYMLLYCLFIGTYYCHIGTVFQLGNPLGRGTKRRREVEDDIKVISLIPGLPLINDAWSMEDIRQAFVIYQSIQPFSINLCFEQAGSMEDIDKLLSTPKKKKLTTTSQYIYRNLFQVRFNIFSN